MDEQTPSLKNRPWAVFLIFLRLGLTSFGGPVAHLGYFREAFVEKRRWLSDQAYGDLVALCQFLPGPASSQVGLALGYKQAGYPGAFAAWLGFTLPSALILLLFALGLDLMQGDLVSGMVKGLKLVAVAVVVQALWGMAKSLCPDGPRASLMIVSAIAMLSVSTVWAQVAIILVSGGLGIAFLREAGPVSGQATSELTTPSKGRLSVSFGFLAFFFVLLFWLPLGAAKLGLDWLALFDSFYRSGALVFGGGHVVLPLLSAELVPSGQVDESIFLAGYGAAQAVPGPLFTFAAFLGASNQVGPTGVSGSLIALVAIFLPSFLLVFAAMPYWDVLRSKVLMRRALLGVNAAVVGLLLAALYDPVWTKGVSTTPDFCFVLLAWLALIFWKLPPWLVVLSGATLGVFLFN
jgi:chromate transporter